jgi:hypothetical protein
MTSTLARARPASLVTILAAVLACSSSGSDQPPSPPILERVEVTPFSPSIVVGSSTAFQATAVYSDGARADVTEQATWSASEASVAAVSDVPGTRGQATATAPGYSFVTATYDAVSGSARAAVVASPPTLLRVDVFPRAPWLVAGTTAALHAVASYSDETRVDVTAQAAWRSSAVAVLTFSDAQATRGVAAAVTAGTATVEATFEGVSGSTEASVLAPGAAATMAGVVTYDSVPAVYDRGWASGTLAFRSAVRRPARGVVVRVMDGPTVLAETTTDGEGHYVLEHPGTGTTVVALAKTNAPPLQVEDNVDGDAVWAIGASTPAAKATVNLHATHGWTGASYDPAARSAAPFAILDAMYTAAKRFTDAGRSPSFPPLRVNWSPENSSARIETSYYSPGEREIYVLGKEGEDTDEFDDHVIVHEWAHYFEDNLSRSDTPGGPHGLGDVLDPRLAFGEGYGTGLAAILLEDPIYADTGWWNGYTLDAWGFSAETVPSPTDDFDYGQPRLNPGPFSEMSIIRALYDLWDPGAGEAWDATAIPLATLYDVLVGPERTTPAFTTIASFVAGLKAQAGVDAAAVDAVLAKYSIGAISDAWGSGDADLSALYAEVPVPGSRSFTLDGRFDWNMQQQNRYLRFTATGASVTVSASSAYDVDLEAYREGVLLASDWSTGTTPILHFATTPGEVYLVLLNGWGDVTGTYAATVDVASP